MPPSFCTAAGGSIHTIPAAAGKSKQNRQILPIFPLLPGLAKRTLALCKEAGVTMTGAGATFPYGVDPQDSNIRIAPSLPPVEELEKAMEVFCVCLRMAALEQLLQK